MLHFLCRYLAAAVDVYKIEDLQTGCQSVSSVVNACASCVIVDMHMRAA